MTWGGGLIIKKGRRRNKAHSRKIEEPKSILGGQKRMMRELNDQGLDPMELEEMRVLKKVGIDPMESRGDEYVSDAEKVASPTERALGGQ